MITSYIMYFLNDVNIKFLHQKLTSDSYLGDIDLIQ